MTVYISYSSNFKRYLRANSILDSGYFLTAKTLDDAVAEVFAMDTIVQRVVCVDSTPMLEYKRK